MRIALWIIVCIMSLACPSAVSAQQEAASSEAGSAAAAAPALDSVRVSFLTCSPGQEIYSLFGHTAIRCVDYTRGTDVVFNYGVFSFSQPHFIWRFVLGECDYMVEAMRFQPFLAAYESRGSRVTEQVLNLTPYEANLLQYRLAVNCRPENCTYRYNFLFNNCTTMVRDVVEGCIDGVVRYEQRNPRQTTRSILRHYTRRHLWASEGIDLLLGMSVDTVASDRAAMFAPEYMMDYAGHAQVLRADGTSRALVGYTDVLAEGREVPVHPGFPLSPQSTAILLLAACIVVALAECFLHRHWAWLDVLLLAAQGLVGVLLLFLALFSQHPAVDANWLLWLFCPISLVGCVVVVAGKSRPKGMWWAFYFLLLSVFLIIYPWIPQDFGNIVVPLTMGLLTRPVSFYFCNRKSRQ